MVNTDYFYKQCLTSFIFVIEKKSFSFAAGTQFLGARGSVVG
jgi:hypothetical protein